MQILLITGLPGSGKTHLADEFRSPGVVIVDDPKMRMEILGHKTHLLVIADPSLIRQDVRASAVQLLMENYPDASIAWIFFENDPDRCSANAHYRVGRMVERYIAKGHLEYTIPVGYSPVPVWTCE